MGTAKPDLVLADGRSMIETVLSTLDQLCSTTIVSGAHVEGRVSLDDTRDHAGPLGGIESVLSSGIDSRYLIVAVDTPMASVDLLRKLTSSGSDIAVFEVPGQSKLQSLPIMISAEVLGQVTQSLDAGRNSIHKIVKDADADLVRLSREESLQLRNINSPDDYKQMTSSADG